MSGYRRRSPHRPETTGEVPDRSQGVLYLRVSSVRQTHTAIDIDADGNSIATQREECTRKARDKGIAIVREFVEPGKSAQTIEKRPEFRQLLAYLAEHPNVGYVFVYSRSRAFRNVEEAILTRQHLRGLGVRIISTKEDFGDSLEASFMEVITDSMNDLQNKRSGEDIKMKMAHKARNGGTVSRAPIGYLNTRIDVEGRLVNSIALDEQRAPLVRLCFDLYATGDYTIEQRAMIRTCGWASAW
jgi:DNA invertase Pin-like site-specific DNA recombinase